MQTGNKLLKDVSFLKIIIFICICLFLISFGIWINISLGVVYILENIYNSYVFVAMIFIFFDFVCILVTEIVKKYYKQEGFDKKIINNLFGFFRNRKQDILFILLVGNLVFLLNQMLFYVDDSKVFVVGFFLAVVILLRYLLKFILRRKKLGIILKVFIVIFSYTSIGIILGHTIDGFGIYKQKNGNSVEELFCQKSVVFPDKNKAFYGNIFSAGFIHEDKKIVVKPIERSVYQDDILLSIRQIFPKETGNTESNKTKIGNFLINHTFEYEILEAFGGGIGISYDLYQVKNNHLFCRIIAEKFCDFKGYDEIKVSGILADRIYYYNTYKKLNLTVKDYDAYQPGFEPIRYVFLKSNRIISFGVKCKLSDKQLTNVYTILVGE